MNQLLRSVGIVTVLAFPALAQGGDAKKALPGGAKAAQDRGAAVKAPKQGGKVGLEESGGNTWFPVTKRELGTFYGSGEAVGLFKFENPSEQEIEWRGLTPSCQCAKAEIRVGERVYRVIAKPQKRIVRVIKEPGKAEKVENVKVIRIGPKEKGEVETRLNMHNITGPKSATLDIHTTDPAEPHTKLTFRAKGAQLFTVSPKEVNLNKMTWNETREFSVTVSSSMRPDWKIIGMDKAPDGFDVKWEQISNGATTSYKISGTYGPVSGDTAGGGVLRFRTDVNGTATFSVRVLAFVQGPLEVKPGGFLTLGLIRKGKPISKNIVFEPNDGVDLQATGLEFEKLTLSKEFIKASQRKDGNKLVIELSVADNTPSGLIKGDLVVKLNHPLVKEKRIMFNGFVR